MQKVSPLVCTLFLTAAAFAQPLTPVDRKKGRLYLQQTEDGVVAALTGLSESQLKFKPAPDRWSAAETLDIALAEDFIFQNVTDKITKAPAGVSERDIAKADAMVLAMTPGRTRKFQAPPPLKPPRPLDSSRNSRSLSEEPLPHDRVPGSNSRPASACRRQPFRPAAGRIRMAAVHWCAWRAPYKTDSGSQVGSKFPRGLTKQ